ncbi:MAG: hypothetical protein SGPRY_007557 [Prymnesium sp.]
MVGLGLLSLSCALARVVVTGGTGRVGSALVDRLVLAHADPSSVCVIVRDPSKAQAMLPQGVVCLTASYEDTEALSAAFAQVGPGFRLFIACSNGPAQEDLESNVCRAAVAAGCSYAVKLSTASAVLEMQQGGPYAAHLKVEQLLSELRLPHAVLRPNLFMNELVGSFLGVKQLQGAQECAHPFADASISVVDIQDVAACAAALLLDENAPSRGAASYFDITGPVAIQLGKELASAISELRPQAVSIVPCSVEEYLAPRELPPGPAASIAGFLEVLKTRCSSTSGAVQELTGEAPKGIQHFVREHAAEFLPRSFSRLVGRQADSFRAAVSIQEVQMAAELSRLAPDECLIRTIVAGVNGGADTFAITRGTASKSEDEEGEEGKKDANLGFEGVGVVVASGKQASHCVGERIVFIGGAYSEYARVPSHLCYAVDAAADAAEQAALRISGLTAAVALGHTAAVGAGDVVVVTACCGATGSFATQIAKAAGARVIGTVGSDSKVEMAYKLGVDRVVNWRRESLARVLAEECPGGVDLAYEGVGGPLLGAICANLSPSGTVLLVGSISQYPHNKEKPPHGVDGIGDVMDDIFRPGKILELPNGRGRLVGNVWGDSRSAGVLPEFLERLYQSHAKGKITALIDDTQVFCGLKQAVGAVEHMLSGRSMGKVVLYLTDENLQQ